MVAVFVRLFLGGAGGFFGCSPHSSLTQPSLRPRPPHPWAVVDCTCMIVQWCLCRENTLAWRNRVALFRALRAQPCLPFFPHHNPLLVSHALLAPANLRPWPSLSVASLASMLTADFLPSGDACSGVCVRVCMCVRAAGSYGSLAMFSNLQRMVKATDTCLIGGSGDYSDFQQVRTGCPHTRTWRCSCR